MGGRKSKKIKNPQLTEEMTKYIEANTNYNVEQIQKHYTGFMKDCPDGYLTHKNLENTYKMICPGGNPKQFCKSVFKAFDANNDGHINFEEYMLAMALVYSDNITDSLKIAFKIYDSDGNGFLSLKELENTLRAICQLKEDHGINANNDNIKHISLRIMDHCDTSKDNQISLEEFIQACQDNQFMLELHTSSF